MSVIAAPERAVIRPFSDARTTAGFMALTVVAGRCEPRHIVTFGKILMKKPTIATLALAIAAGRSIASWCRETGTARRSAYRMARTSECRQLVEEIRRRAIDRAIGELARHALKSAQQITRLATKAQSEAVQLAAARAGISDMMALADFAGLERRMAAIEERLRADAGESPDEG
jgi:hypothetical protein